MSTLREQIADVELTEPAHEALRIAIRQMIDDCGLKQVWVAAQLGITTKHMSALLANNRDRKVHMTVDWATRIVAVCGHPLRLTITPQEWVHDTITWRQRAETAEARLAEQENAVTWLTSCLNCSSLLDSSYADYVRAEKAEALLAERDAEIARLTPETHPCECPDADGSYAHLAGHTRQLVQRTDQLMAEVDAQEARIAAVVESIGEEQAGRQAAEAIAARARDLHCRDDSNPLGPWCGTCSVPWPCQTWEALIEPAHPKET